MKVAWLLSLSLMMLAVSSCSLTKMKINDAEKHGQYAQAYFLAENEYRESKDQSDLDAMKKYSAMEMTKQVNDLDNAITTGRFSSLPANIFSLNSETEKMLSNASDYHIVVNGMLIFEKLKDSAAKALDNSYNMMISAYKSGNYEETISIANEIAKFRNVEFYRKSSLSEIDYAKAQKLFTEGRYKQSYRLFTGLDSDFRDSKLMAAKCIELGRTPISVSCPDGVFRGIVMEKIVYRFRDNPFYYLVDERANQYGMQSGKAVAGYLVKVDILRDQFNVKAAYTLVESKSGVISGLKNYTRSLNSKDYLYQEVKSSTTVDEKVISSGKGESKKGDSSGNHSVESPKTVNKTTVTQKEYETKLKQEDYDNDMDYLVNQLAVSISDDLTNDLNHED